MTAKELVVDFLKANDIEPEKTEFGLRFFLDNWSFLLWEDPQDPNYFRLTLPGIFDVTDENFAEAIMACNAINMQYKVVKAILFKRLLIIFVTILVPIYGPFTESKDSLFAQIADDIKVTGTIHHK